MTSPRPAVLLVAAAMAAVGLFWLLGHERATPPPPAAMEAKAARGVAPETNAPARDDLQPITVYAHNLRLRKGPQFRVYVRWIRGEMQRTRRDETPSFDDPDSFVLEIQKGVIRANIGDISNFLNANMPKGAPLTNVSLQPSGDSLKLRGTVHKLVPLPVELDGRLSPMPDGRIRFHVEKINVLKIPLKGLLGGMHVQLSDVVKGTGVAGVEVAGNDVFFDTRRLLPPPHIHGQITAVRVATPDLEVIYGSGPVDEGQLSQWHNFFRLRGGTLGFGNLTMHPVDLTMIDASQEPWFDLDLVNYQAQLVKGYTRITEQAGLEIFMPDVSDTSAPKKASPAVTLDWLRNRRLSVPKGIPVK